MFSLAIYFICEGQGKFFSCLNVTYQFRILLVYLLILVLYWVFLKEGCSDALPGVFTQYFLVLTQYKDLRWLSSRGALISIFFHLYLSETIGLEPIVYASVPLFLSLFLLDSFFEAALVWGLPFTLLLLILDPRLAFWGACLSVFFITFNSLFFFVRKRKEDALQALAYFFVLLIFLVYFFFSMDPTIALLPNLLSYCAVSTTSELMFLCGFTLAAGASIIFALVNEEGPAWVTLLLYGIVCGALALFCLVYRPTEVYKWSMDMLFFLSSFFVYALSTFVFVRKPVEETLPFFFAALALHYSRVYVLLSPGIQSWLLGFGGLTLLVQATSTLFTSKK